MPRYLVPASAIARQLRDLRLQLGWSQREAARHIGVSYSVVQRLEGGSGVSPRNSLIVAEFWGLDPAAFYESTKAAA